MAWASLSWRTGNLLQEEVRALDWKGLGGWDRGLCGPGNALGQEPGVTVSLQGTRMAQGTEQGKLSLGKCVCRITAERSCRVVVLCQLRHNGHCRQGAILRADTGFQRFQFIISVFLRNLEFLKKTF